MHTALVRLCGSITLCFYSGIKHHSHRDTLPALLHSNHNTGMWDLKNQRLGFPNGRHPRHTQLLSTPFYVFQKSNTDGLRLGVHSASEKPSGRPRQLVRVQSEHTSPHTYLCDISFVWMWKRASACILVSSLSPRPACLKMHRKKFRFKQLKRKELASDSSRELSWWKWSPPLGISAFWQHPAVII